MPVILVVACAGTCPQLWKDWTREDVQTWEHTWHEVGGEECQLRLS